MVLDPIPELHNIVIVGHWNVLIFTPAWISARFAQQPEIEVAFPLTMLAPNVRFGLGNVFLVVSPDKLTLFSRDMTDASFNRMKDIAVQILTDLSHTPVSGLGLNFVLKTDEPNEQMLSVFQTGDRDSLIGAGAVIRLTNVRRVVTINERNLNLSVSYDPNAPVATIDFNFHAEITSPEDAITKIGDGLVPLRPTVEDICRNIYQAENILWPPQ